MKSKERMLLALNMEKPDRVPVTLHQWQPYHLEKYMGGISDIEAFRKVELDAAITFYEVTDESSSEWRIDSSVLSDDGTKKIIKYQVTTPEGVLSYTHGINPMTSWVVEPMIKKEDDIQLIRKYRSIPRFSSEKLKKKYDLLGDDGIMRTFIWGYQGGCWQDACELYGVENLILATFDKPEWVHELLSILLEQKLKYIEANLKNLPLDLIETGGGAASNTIISPAIHRDFCLPYDRKMHDALHSLNYKVVYHTCGGMMKILDYLPLNGADASETLSPPEIGGDIKKEDMVTVKKTLGSKIPLIGGIDQLTILPGSDDDIRKEVAEKFEGYGEDGGYIMSASDHFFELGEDRIAAFSRAARECVY